MIESGLIKPNNDGCYFILPLLQRSVEKLTSVIDEFLNEIDCQKMTMPTLTSKALWKKSRRFEQSEAELMVLRDRHDKEQILSPVSNQISFKESEIKIKIL